MQHYWDKLFECNHLIYLYDVLDKLGNIKTKYQWMYMGKINNSPIWNKEKFKFTQSINTLKECCTVKYKSTKGKYISMGVFQAHNNRDCLKFGFIMKGLLELINSNSI